MNWSFEFHELLVTSFANFVTIVTITLSLPMITTLYLLLRLFLCVAFFGGNCIRSTFFFLINGNLYVYIHVCKLFRLAFSNTLSLMTTPRQLCNCVDSDICTNCSKLCCACCSHLYGFLLYCFATFLRFSTNRRLLVGMHSKQLANIYVLRSHCC